MGGTRMKAPVTAHIFLLRGGQVLLLRRFNTGYEDGRYSVVAGHLDVGETVIEAAIREAREEVGVEIHPDDLRLVGVMQRKSNDERIDFFLAASAWSGEAVNQEPDKCDDLRWCQLESLPDNTIPYVRKALGNFQAGRWFEVFGWERPALARYDSPRKSKSRPVGVEVARVDSSGAQAEDHSLAEWTRLRAALWPDCPGHLHAKEISDLLADAGENVCFLAWSVGGEAVGFVEVSLRRDAPGCTTGPVGYLEGWYVSPGWRRQGVGTALVEAAESWARSRAAREMASDTQVDNTTSWLSHRQLGYQEVERAVHFCKRLNPT